MLPTAKSSALKTVRPYRYMLGCNLSPALRSRVNSCLPVIGLRVVVQRSR